MAECPLSLHFLTLVLRPKSNVKGPHRIWVALEDGWTDLRCEAFICSCKDKMLIQRDFDLNSAQRYTGSSKEVLKRTILDQEIMFREQVHELHWWYGTLMEILNWKELESYSWEASLSYWLRPFSFIQDANDQNFNAVSCYKSSFWENSRWQTYHWNCCCSLEWRWAYSYLSRVVGW